MNKERLILSHHRAPGDLTCLSALLRDIHLTYPGRFETDLATSVTPLWQNNPYVTKLWNHNSKAPKLHHKGTRWINCQYGKGLKEQNRETIHFISYFHRDFQRQTGIPVKLHYPYGDIHLSNAEKSTPPVLGRYWLMMVGGKSDYPIKAWYSQYYQEVANRLGDIGLGVVQSGAAFRGHWHPRLKGDHVIDLVGWGGFREWLQQIYHAEGVICGVTGAMHIAAALQKPCVVVGGGREAWWWEAYVRENRGLGDARHKLTVPHKYLHTIGLLDCCRHHGCWRDKLEPGNHRKPICLRPIRRPEMTVAECMMMVTPEHVTEAVMEYYTDNTLKPIQLKDSMQPATTPVATPPPNTTHAKTSGTFTIPTGVPIRINPKANVTVKPHTPVTQPTDGKAAVMPKKPVTQQQQELSTLGLYDDPRVGGKMTICVLLYGGEEYHELHKRCIGSILATVPQDRVDIRVGSNALNEKSKTMIDEFVTQGLITKHYVHPDNDYKYPVMREMFFDPELPITTKWVLWFDDDSICDVDHHWFEKLAQHMRTFHKGKEAHMIGAMYTWKMNQPQKQIFASRPWYSGRPWRGHNGKPSPNGNTIVFATGGFFAITYEAIVAADIPDLGTGLTHTGGDWQIGEQLYQAGYGLKMFNAKKQFVNTSSVKRRGVTMPTIDMVGQ